MMTRRQILVGSSGGLAAGAAWAFAPTWNVSAPGAGGDLALFLFDRSVHGALLPGRALARRGVAVRSFHGDVGVPWLEVLEPMWRRGPRPVAGITDGGALFCLEQLAWRHGMACALRLALPVARSGRSEDAADMLLRAAGQPPGSELRPSTDMARGPVAWLFQPVEGNGR